MKNNIAWLCLLVFAFSCSSSNTAAIVNQLYIDSVLQHYTLPASVKANDAEMAFWKNKLNPASSGMVNESKYAATLITRFHQLGNIKDVKTADSIVKKINADYNYKEASPNATLVTYAILQHRFKEAEMYLQKARELGLRKNESLSISFDVDFELGRQSNAALYVKQLQPQADYGYYFRRSKMEHYNGAIDSSIQAMLKAAELAAGNNYLQNIALSNAADLYIHAGDLKKANNLYVQCIKLNSGDLHSLTGLGWIALVHDKKDTLAEKIFKFVQTITQLPDPLFKLYQMAQGRGDTVLQTTYATAFVAQATDTLYGYMYNKYLIELYTGILHAPEKAVAISKAELNNRATPQTYAWYAYSLLANNKKEEAQEVFDKYISGKPLEGLELYWMGKLMLALSKSYNANAFFKEAHKNYYDLGPEIQMALKKMDL